MVDKKCSKFSEKKRESIVEAALELFLDRGYGSVSMDEIACKANVSKRTVYNHFASKEELFGEIVKLMWSSFEQPSLLLGESTDAKKILTDYTLNILEMFRSERFTKMIRLVMGESGRFPELNRLHSEQGVKTVLGVIEDFFENLNSAGIIKSDDVPLAAQQYVGMVKESLFWPVMFGIFEQPTPERDREVIKISIDIIFDIYSV